jgi:3-deoxy-manno-octulosonate cytidylyltransferase (CMP-KDO synthetase)
MFAMFVPKKFIGIIPARFASTRFPGKPLANIRGKMMIQRVYEQASKVLETVYVATDDERIYKAVKGFGGRVVMTSNAHSSGTERCAEAVKLAEHECSEQYDIVLNIQGDEPFIEPQQLVLLKECFDNPATQIATLVKAAADPGELLDPNRPKVVVSINNEAIYFSRAVIPFVQGKEMNDWLNVHTYYLHIGLYGYMKEVLFKITVLPQSPLELTESLEQLRWIENGYRISVRITTYDSFGIDTPEDLERLQR